MGPWRSDPALAEYMHNDDPDVVSVCIHSGGPRPAEIVVQTTSGPNAFGPQRNMAIPHQEVLPAETIPVRVLEKRGRAYVGILEADAQVVPGFKRSAVIQFLALRKAAPFLIAETYFPERNNWIITPCLCCGFSELLIPAHDIIRDHIAASLSAGDRVESFSWACICGNFVLVSRSANAPWFPKPWWKFWW